MPIDFDLWAQRSDTLKIYLVELTALRLADQAQIPLYLSRGKTVVFNNCCYLDCVAGMPRFARQANGNLSPADDPALVPSRGELEINIEPLRRPDAYNSLTWQELLASGLYTFRHQDLAVKVGGEGFAYGDFRPVFSGRVDACSWNDGKLTMKIYGRERDFDQEICDYSLPESPYVVEASQGSTVPALLGFVQNYKPVLISETETGAYPWKYALACHVINRLTAIYGACQQYEWSWMPGPLFGMGVWVLVPVPGGMELRLKDVLPAEKIAIGSATMRTFGPYTGSLYRAKWEVIISSVTRLNEVGASGPEVGLAAFDWYLNGVKQNTVPILTWKLAPGAVTKDPAVGLGVMTLGGEYTGEIKRDYLIEILTEGKIGGSQTPQYRFSDDGGGNWSAAIDILDTDPDPLSHGLTAAFTGATGHVGEATPGPVTTGVLTTSGDYSGDVSVDYRVEVTDKIADLSYRWTNDGGASWNGPFTTAVPSAPILLEDEVYVTFESELAQYTIGDYWDFTAYPPFVAGDVWAFNFVEIPIPLADGVAVQFYTQAGVDCVLGDKFEFILGSTLLLANQGDGVSITADAEGLISPADDLYTENAGGLMQAVLMAWRGWSAADFDQAALAALDAALPYQLGVLVDSPTPIQDVFKNLLAGLPVIHTLDDDDRLTAAEIVQPAGDPVVLLTDVEFLDNPEANDEGDIFWRVFLNYGKNCNVDNQPVGAPTQERVEWLRREYRMAQRQDKATLDRYPWARDIGPVDTALVQRADALALGDKLLVLWQESRKPVKITTRMLLAHLPLWSKIGVQRTRLGEETPVVYASMGLELDYTGSKSTLTLWR